MKSGFFMDGASSELMGWQCCACGKTIRASLRDAGKQLGCPQCGVRQVVPGRPAAAGSTPPSSAADTRGGQAALLGGNFSVTPGRYFRGNRAGGAVGGSSRVLRDCWRVVPAVGSRSRPAPASRLSWCGAACRASVVRRAEATVRSCRRPRVGVGSPTGRGSTATWARVLGG